MVNTSIVKIAGESVTAADIAAISTGSIAYFASDCTTPLTLPVTNIQAGTTICVKATVGGCTVTEMVTVTVNANTYYIYLQVNPAEGGTASANVNTATAGTEIILTATPVHGYRFKEWQVVSGGVSISNNKFTMPATNVTVRAVFELESTEPTYTVTVINGSGGGRFAEGATVTITANKPPTGQHFSIWEMSTSLSFVDGTSETSSTAKFTMPAHSVTAKAIYRNTINFPKYAIVKWANTIALNIRALEEIPGLGKVTGNFWYLPDDGTHNGIYYSAGPRITDKLVHGTYRFVLIASSGLWYSSDWVYPTDFIPRLATVSSYPNPLSSGTPLTIDGVEEGSLIEVFSQTGIRVLQTIATGNRVTLMLNVPSGLYVVRTTNGEIKLVIEN
jgi:hypothetical protein